MHDNSFFLFFYKFISLSIDMILLGFGKYCKGLFKWRLAVLCPSIVNHPMQVNSSGLFT